MSRETAGTCERGNGSIRAHRSRRSMVGVVIAIVALLSAVLPGARIVRAALVSGPVIVDVNTDKARYNPGDTVTIYVDMQNTTGQAITNGSVTLYFKHLDQQVSPSQAQTLTLNPGASTTLSWTWTPPTTDFQGYAVEAWVRDSTGTILDNLNTAVDVSSDWSHFPRYGYMATYPSQDEATSDHAIWQLKNYHIDGLQFYDWQYKHHIPLAGTVSNPAASWNDIANRTNYRQTVLDFLNAAHGYNMLGFAYNAANAAYPDYASDGSGVSPSWGFYKDTSCSSAAQDNYSGFPSNWAASGLDLFNPADTNWQNYIFGQEGDMFAAYPFDGWHVDQLVVTQNGYTCGGSPVAIDNTFAGFLTAAKAALNKRIIFNDSGESALADVAKTNDDVLYTEFGDTTTYAALKADVDTATADSGGSKAVVQAAYMDQNDATSNPGGAFNTPGVLLADAAIFASGGDHIELGDGTHMLDSPYFPNRNLTLSASLQQQLHNYYDFMVAYENLLRGGLSNTGNTVQLSAGSPIATSANGAANTVWAMTKSGAGYDTINLVNLLGESSTDALDSNGDHPVPAAQDNVTVKYYYGAGTINSVAWASPDDNNGKSTDLSYTTGSDGGGAYVSFTVPSLQYWDLLYINKTPGTGQQLFFDDFESGNAARWTPYDGSWSVCQVGNNSKEYCAGSTAENISLAGDTTWTNDNVQGYVVANGTASASVCLLTRVQDGSHFYQLELKNGSSWEIWKNNGDMWSQIASGSFPWSAGAY